MAKKHVSLPWLRWEVDTHRDAELLELPACQRWLWPVLVDLGGKASPRGSIHYTEAQLAKEADMPIEDVTCALARFEEWGKVARKNGWINIRNFAKYNPPLRLLSHGQRGSSVAGGKK